MVKPIVLTKDEIAEGQRILIKAMTYLNGTRISTKAKWELDTNCKAAKITKREALLKKVRLNDGHPVTISEAEEHRWATGADYSAWLILYCLYTSGVSAPNFVGFTFIPSDSINVWDTELSPNVQVPSPIYA